MFEIGESVKFSDCSASDYGPQIAAPARELVRISNRTFLDYYNQSSSRRQEILEVSQRLNVTQPDSPCLTSYVYGGVQSGGNVPTTWFALLDKYGQVVQTNSGGQLQFNLVTPKEA